MGARAGCSGLVAYAVSSRYRTQAAWPVVAGRYCASSRKRSSCLRCPPRRRLMRTVERLLRREWTVRVGSIAPIRFLKQLAFDQLSTWLGSPILERPLCRFLHCGWYDELRLLCLGTCRSRRDCSRTRVAGVGRFGTVVRAVATTGDNVNKQCGETRPQPPTARRSN
jgi:hypothetical protein